MPKDDYGFGLFGWVNDRYGVSWQLSYDPGTQGMPNPIHSMAMIASVRASPCDGVNGAHAHSHASTTRRLVPPPTIARIVR